MRAKRQATFQGEDKEHTHNPVIGLDGILRCKNCGKIGGVYVEVIAQVQSLKVARKLLDTMSLGWGVDGVGEHSAIYTQTKGEVEIERYVEKKGDRQWQIIEVTKQKEVI